MAQVQNGGRHPELTPELHQAIIDDIAAAIPYEYAAGANGISERILYIWKARGEKEQDEGLDTIYTRFFQDIKKAERKRINKHLTNIDKGDDKWVCDAWILERRWWKHYSKNAPLIEIEERIKKMEEAQDAHAKPKQVDSESNT